MVVIFCSFTSSPPPLETLVPSWYSYQHFLDNHSIWHRLLPVIPLGLINGIFILITNRATKAHRRRKDNYRIMQGKQRRKAFLSLSDETVVVFYRGPWYTCSALLNLQPCSFTVTFQLIPINGTVAVFFSLVFKSVEPLNVFFFENIVN